MEKIFEDCLVAVLVSKDNPAAQAAEVQRLWPEAERLAKQPIARSAHYSTAW